MENKKREIPRFFPLLHYSEYQIRETHWKILPQRVFMLEISLLRALTICLKTFPGNYATKSENRAAYCTIQFIENRAGYCTIQLIAAYILWYTWDSDNYVRMLMKRNSSHYSTSLSLIKSSSVKPSYEFWLRKYAWV